MRKRLLLAGAGTLIGLGVVFALREFREYLEIMDQIGCLPDEWDIYE